MDNLRLILITIGAVVLLGIYLWGVLRKRQGSHYQHLDEINPDGLNDLPVTQPVSQPNTASTDESCSHSVPDNTSNKAAMEPTEEIVPAPPPKPIAEPLLDIAAEKTSSEDDKETLQQLSSMVKECHEPIQIGLQHLNVFTDEPQEMKPREYIVINVVARKGQTMKGPALVTAMENAGMIYGQMDIFHGLIPDSYRQRTMFSIASMLEPGVFNMDSIHELTTPGLVMFMGMPSAMDNLECFEEMLATAHALAEELHARVLDESHSTMTKQGEDAIRDRIQQFDLHDGACQQA